MYLQINYIVAYILGVMFVDMYTDFGLLKSCIIVTICIIIIKELHERRITYMFISLLFSIADGLLLGYALSTVLNDYYGTDFFVSTMGTIMMTIVGTLFFVYLYYYTAYGHIIKHKSISAEEQVRRSLYQEDHDKWIRGQNYYNNFLNMELNHGKSMFIAKRNAKKKAKEALRNEKYNKKIR